MSTKTLILLRGLPGAGKTTLANTLANLNPYDSRIVAADDYFYNDKKEYVFDVSQLRAAHNYCVCETEICMDGSCRLIIVHNTFTTEKEMKPYFELANSYGYTVSTCIVENRHASQSVHGVPEETLTKMRSRFNVKL